MASFGIQLSFFLLLVLVLSPKIQAREGKFLNFFTHFRTIYNVNPQVLLKKAKSETPAPAPAPLIAPTPSPITAPTSSPITAPTPAPAPAPAPEAAPEQGSIIASGPAPEPQFVDNGEGYGLYGTDSTQYSENKESPTTTYTNFENQLLDEDFTSEKYKTGYPKTNLYNNYNNEVYRNNYNSEEYRSNYNNGYNKNYVDSYSNNYNGNEYYNNNNYKGNDYEGKREGMSDTRFLENGKYSYHVNTDNQNYNYNLNNGYESERGSTENEGYYEKSQYPNEFDTMEEYEKQLERQGYTP